MLSQTPDLPVKNVLLVITLQRGRLCSYVRLGLRRKINRFSGLAPGWLKNPFCRGGSDHRKVWREIG